MACVLLTLTNPSFISQMELYNKKLPLQHRQADCCWEVLDNVSEQLDGFSIRPVSIESQRRGLQYNFRLYTSIVFCAHSPFVRFSKMGNPAGFIQSLLPKRVNRVVPHHQRGQGVYSILFMVGKASGNFRPVFGLKTSTLISLMRSSK